ncbi:unnamed protein product [Leptidea sinapis]|uniref:Uncharacterized protein n=1 Tax=Leptidea sinapis TaxID=189913 RepID=A0A5E4Q235_9NEOP|nr:unnamed protein product [Leptidea sinapis]
MDKRRMSLPRTNNERSFSVMSAPLSASAQKVKTPLRPISRSTTFMKCDSASKSETSVSNASTAVETLKQQVVYGRASSKSETSVSNANTPVETLKGQVLYSRFLRTMLEDCLIDDKIKREENEMDIQMAQLLLDLKNQDCTKFHELTDQSNVQSVMKNLATTEQACLDRLETKNVDFGYNKESGHKQLLDAVNDAIDGLEQIKIRSNLDMDKCKEFEKTQKCLDDLEKDRSDLSMLKDEFDEKFPEYCHKVIIEVSDKIDEMKDDDFDL